MTLPAPERARLRTARERVMAYLLAHGTATNAELWAIGGNAAIRRLWDAQDDLGKQGYRVDKIHERAVRDEDWHMLDQDADVLIGTEGPWHRQT